VRARLERRLNQTWYGKQPPGLLLRLAEQAYRGAAAMARSLNALRKARDLEGRPIIVVGNLTAGGAGKTPLVIRLCALAADCGLRAGVVSRGYGRRGTEPLWVEADSDAALAGDEPLLIARRAGVPVRVDARRERALRALFERGLDIAIADDGLQRTQMPRSLEICVVDAERGFGNGHLLPAGPLRESTARLDGFDFVVEHAAMPGPNAPTGRYQMHLQAGALRTLDGRLELSVETLRATGRALHAVAGIARPERFFATLERLGLAATNHALPDHHRFERSDFAQFPRDSIIIMTEKDAVKCRHLGLENAWCLPVSAVLEPRLETALAAALRAMTAEKEAKPHA
jgi:tetraacyldisaccharide 4'-kinase